MVSFKIIPLTVLLCVLGGANVNSLSLVQSVAKGAVVENSVCSLYDAADRQIAKMFSSSEPSEPSATVSRSRRQERPVICEESCGWKRISSTYGTFISVTTNNQIYPVYFGSMHQYFKECTCLNERGPCNRNLVIAANQGRLCCRQKTSQILVLVVDSPWGCQQGWPSIKWDFITVNTGCCCQYD